MVDNLDMTVAEDIGLRRMTFTPAQTGTIGVAAAEEVAANAYRAMPFPIKNVDSYFAPLLPGQTCIVQAQTSNGKSLFIRQWEQFLAQYLVQQGRDEIIIHVDTEHDIESLAMTEIAIGSGISISRIANGHIREADRPALMGAAGRVSGVPIYRISDSGDMDEEDGELHLTNIVKAIRYITDGRLTGRKMKVACIFIDYLQALAIDPTTKAGRGDADHFRRIQVRNDVYMSKRIGKPNAFDCGLVIGAQAKQTLTGHPGPNMMIPGTYDGEETSAIGQRSSRVVSLWMPKATHTIGDTLTHKGLSFKVEEDTMFLKVNKQQGMLPAGKIWQCKIDYSTGFIHTV